MWEASKEQEGEGQEGRAPGLNLVVIMMRMNAHPTMIILMNSIVSMIMMMMIIIMFMSLVLIIIITRSM